jgi:hypothetical protein
MKTVVNRSRAPIRIHLPGGKTLHLGPGKSGQVSDAACERPSLKKLVKDGEVQVLDEGEAAALQDSPSSKVQESTHGHRPPNVVMPKGNR